MQTDISSDINTNSSPSQLKITDVRLVQVSTGGPILKIDTNQDIYGLGEVRDGASITYALMLKSRLLGQNPCQVDKIFRQIKQFGHHARQGGGVSAVEMALMDLTGKAYGIPCYQLAGGKFRNRIRCYSDTPVLNDPVEMGQKLIERVQRGFTFLQTVLARPRNNGYLGWRPSRYVASCVVLGLLFVVVLHGGAASSASCGRQ